LTAALPFGVAAGPFSAWSPDGRSLVALECRFTTCERLVILDATGAAEPIYVDVPGGLPPLQQGGSWGPRP
jgi:hypothetical protein